MTLLKYKNVLITGGAGGGITTAQAIAAATDLPVHTGDLASLSQVYEAIHLADVLEHCPCPYEILIRVRSLLAPGGIVVARGPLENQVNLFQWSVKLSRLLRSRLRWIHRTIITPYHLVLFSLEGWKSLLRRAGFLSINEWVHELHWPAPEKFSLRLASLIKATSILLSKSTLGRQFYMGNRVLSVLTANHSMSTV